MNADGQAAATPPGPWAQLREFVVFVALGSLAAGANYLSRFPLDLILPFEAAVTMAYLIGMVIAFLVFRHHVFKAQTGVAHRQAYRFVIVNLVGIALTVVVSTLMARRVLPALDWTWAPYAVAHAVGVAAPTITSYFGHKYYTYRA